MDIDVAQEAWLDELEAAKGGAAEAVAALKDAVKLGAAMLTNTRLVMVAQAVSDLRAVRGKGVDAIGLIALARGSALELARPKAAAAQRKSAKEALVQLSALEKQLLALDTHLLAATKAVEKRLSQLFDASRHFNGLLASAAATLGVVEPTFETAKERLTRLADLARQHRDERNPVRLKEDAAQVEAVALKSLEAAIAGIGALLAKIETDSHAASQETRKERVRDWHRLRDRHEQLGDGLQRLQTVRNMVRAMKVETIDLARAAKLLGLPEGRKSALERALRGPESEVIRKLDTLSKEEGLARSGKEILALLYKERLI